MLAYTDTDVAVPFTWVESDAKLITNPQMVKLHSFDTKVRFVGFPRKMKGLDLLKLICSNIFLFFFVGLCRYIRWTLWSHIRLMNGKSSSILFYKFVALWGWICESFIHIQFVDFGQTRTVCVCGWIQFFLPRGWQHGSSVTVVFYPVIFWLV